jgi:hypothetical protein
VPFPDPHRTQPWVDGQLRLTHMEKGFRRVPVFELNEHRATPGTGMIMRLYEVAIETFDHHLMNLRGIEAVRLDPGGPIVGVVQQWRVDLDPEDTDRVLEGGPSGEVAPI